jgi:hypothetical protein
LVLILLSVFVQACLRVFYYGQQNRPSFRVVLPDIIQAPFGYQPEILRLCHRRHDEPWSAGRQHFDGAVGLWFSRRLLTLNRHTPGLSVGADAGLGGTGA